MFQHTATRRWLRNNRYFNEKPIKFQHTATRRWLLARVSTVGQSYEVSTHSHPKVAAGKGGRPKSLTEVSTHSHPKVAADVDFIGNALIAKFQHTATRRWLLLFRLTLRLGSLVSTHSHPKVAAAVIRPISELIAVSTHSHPKVAAGDVVADLDTLRVSTHSHPKVAAVLLFPSH